MLFVSQAYDMRPVKAAVRRLLAVGHPLREAVLAEPDELSREEAAIKLSTLYSVTAAMQQ